jgi:hypothetical protein
MKPYNSAIDSDTYSARLRRAVRVIADVSRSTDDEQWTLPNGFFAPLQWIRWLTALRALSFCSNSGESQNEAARSM